MSSRLNRWIALAGSLTFAHGSPGQAQQAAPISASEPAVTRILDTFDNVDAWHATPSDGFSLTVSRDTGKTGSAMRLDFDFHGGAGYAVVHRALDVDLPSNYEMSFWIRGAAPSNNVEVKLLDASGDNVWWVNRQAYVFPEEWTRFTVKKRQVSFAWGPQGGGELHHFASLELAITAGTGGKGSIWIDDLTLSRRDPIPPIAPKPVAYVASTTGSTHPEFAADGRPGTEWRTASDSNTWLALDLGFEREYGGLIVDWDQLDYARDYDVETSLDGTSWSTAYSVHGGNGGRDYVYMPETESRRIRLVLLKSSRGKGYSVREIAVQPLAWAASPNAFDFAVARDPGTPRGSYPRAFTDSVQTYWTVVGAPAAEREALVGEDGSVEVGKGMFTLEPFLFADGVLASWANVRTTQSLDRGDLPIPSVRWEPLGRKLPCTLTTTAWVEGPVDSAVLLTRYRVTNDAATTRHVTLFVTVRPFQVNAPWQFLNTTGGFAPVRSLAYDGKVIRVNREQPGRGQTAIPITRPDAFGAATFDAGGVYASMRKDSVPTAQATADSLGRADGALAYRLDIPANDFRDVIVAVPFGTVAPPAALTNAQAVAFADSALARTRAQWAEQVDRVVVDLPASAGKLARTLRSMQAYILINQDGPAIQPGSRSYERSWIRDGALTSEALLRTGHADRVRAFLEWYAPYQYANGKVPCCVDARGADPVPEHDSDGEFIYLVSEYYKYTRDTSVLVRMWPHVARAASYLDSLRRTERTPAYEAPTMRSFYGLLPPSISHEGYSAKAMHSYWDDFWALRGFKDAAAIASTLGKADTARHLTGIADEFRTDLLASITASMRDHHVDFIPGAADLGDFDATSTTIALDPGGEQSTLPPAALTHTFDRYWREHLARTTGQPTWDAYTPYELRTVGAFVRLGQPERALALLSSFLHDQRPPGWNEWAEVVGRDARKPRFIGDMPHTWVGSDFLRSLLDLFAYERESDSTLVIGAGVPEVWARSARGVSVRGLRTPYGLLDLSLISAADSARVDIRGHMRVPAGGFSVHAPFPARARSGTVNGVSASLTADGSVLVRAVPAVVRFQY
ncbi:MAG: discoidin domain-containing protein [Gemmatimonadaceae bacterium]